MTEPWQQIRDDHFRKTEDARVKLLHVAQGIGEAKLAHDVLMAYERLLMKDRKMNLSRDREAEFYEIRVLQHLRTCYRKPEDVFRILSMAQPEAVDHQTPPTPRELRGA